MVDQRRGWRRVEEEREELQHSPMVDPKVWKRAKEECEGLQRSVVGYVKADWRKVEEVL